MGRQRDRSNERALLKAINACELCGNTRNLEVHHIIPLCTSVPSIDLENKDNLIVICGNCHTRLTNKSMLTKYGLAKKRKIYHLQNKINEYRRKYYETFDEYDGYFSQCDMFDEFDKWIKDLSDELVKIYE